MSFALRSNFFANARGVVFLDGGGLVWSFNQNTNSISATGTSGSSLSSVGLSDASTTAIYTIGNSPLIANGSLTMTLKTQTTNTVFAGPASGLNAQPTFRALVVNDLPSGYPYSELSGPPTLPTGANPSAKVGLSAVNGNAPTFMTSDSAPPIDQTIGPNMTGSWTFTPTTGHALTIVQNNATSGLLFNGSNPEGWRIDTTDSSGSYCQIYNNGTFCGFLGAAAQEFTGGAVADFGIGCASGKKITFGIGGSIAVSINGATTTGAQTATFAATNKPGSATAAPIAWLPVMTAGGVQGYIPIFGA